jgi:hypothetical protein
MNRLGIVTMIYSGWIVAHYIAPHAYVKFCVPPTWTGFLLSPLNASSPHCIAIRWVIYKGGNSIVMMWVLAGLWVLKAIKPTQSKCP